MAVQVGPDLLQLLLRAELGDALFQAILGQRQPGRLGLVPGGAVGPGEHVQPGQQRPGVAHVAAHRGIGPLARAVPVEAQVQRDQGAHLVHHRGRETQRLQPGPGHRRTDRLVVVERDPPVRQQAARLRLADVMQQRGQPEHQVRFQPVLRLQVDGLLQHGERVLVHVLVPHVLVGFQPQPGHLGQHHISDAGVHQQFDAANRASPGRQHQLAQLVADPLGGHHAEPPGEVVHGHGHLGYHGEAKLGREPGRAHDPQRVVGERGGRAARGAQHLAAQITQSAERVGQLQRRQRRGHRVDGEVAAPQVFLQRRAIPGDRLAGVRPVGLAPVGGHLEHDRPLAHPDRAELDAGLPHPVRPALGDLQHRFRQRVGGQVQVAVPTAEKHVPDRPADQGQLIPMLGEHPAEFQRGRGRRAQQRRGGFLLARADGRGIRHGH